MSKRVTGYHYVTDSKGRRHRVYSHGVPRPIQGQGGYYQSNFVKKMRKYVPKGTFSAIGSAAGQALARGSPMGAQLGAAAGSALARIAGFGDYALTKNSLISEGQSPANMHQGNSSLKVRHREYIMDIVSGPANTFNNQTFPIQPGLNTVFPWLAPIAAQYEQWRPLGIVFEYKTLYADAIASSAANSSLGGVIMATDYNAINPAFPSKQAMDNTEYTTSCKPSVSFYHPIECAPRDVANPLYYIRSGAVPQGSDARLYDLGTLNVATFGIASANVVVGELWATYEIELLKPISTTASGFNVLSDSWQLDTTTSTQPTAVLGENGSQVLAKGSSLGCKIVVDGSANSTVYLPPNIQDGNFLVNLVLYGDAATISWDTQSFVNCSLITMWLQDDDSTIQIPPDGTSSVSFAFLFAINVSGPNASFTFAPATLPLNARGDLIITQLDADISS